MQPPPQNKTRLKQNKTANKITSEHHNITIQLVGFDWELRPFLQRTHGLFWNAPLANKPLVPKLWLWEIQALATEIKTWSLPSGTSYSWAGLKVAAPNSQRSNDNHCGRQPTSSPPAWGLRHETPSGPGVQDFHRAQEHVKVPASIDDHDGDCDGSICAGGCVCTASTWQTHTHTHPTPRVCEGQPPPSPHQGHFQENRPEKEFNTPTADSCNLIVVPIQRGE